MHAEADVLGLIQAAFGERGATAVYLFRVDEGFRSLCEDYYDCVISMERLSDRSTGQPDRRRREYAELLLDLDREIQDWVDRDGPTVE